jgi:hypothetical protein
MASLPLRLNMAWLALRGDFHALADLANASAISLAPKPKAPRAAKPSKQFAALTESSERWSRAFRSKELDPILIFEQGQELLRQWETLALHAPLDQAEHWARRARDACEEHFIQDDFERLPELAELCTRLHEVWRAPWNAQDATCKWVLNFDRARRKVDYARWLHGLWRRAGPQAPLSASDWVSVIQALGSNLHHIARMVHKEGAALPDHVELVRLNASWGFPDEPMSLDDLERAIDKLCDHPHEVQALRQRLGSIAWTDCALLYFPKRFNAQHAIEFFDFDILALLESAFDERALQGAVKTIPDAPASSPQRL